MEKAGSNFIVISCNSCLKAHGAKKVASRCPRCGNSLTSNHEIITTCSSASELQELVMIHNMPKDLRQGFEQMLTEKASKSQKIKKNDKTIWLDLARKSTSADQKIRIDVLRELLKKNEQISPVEVVLEQLSIEGLVIRGANNCWMLLE